MPRFGAAVPAAAKRGSIVNWVGDSVAPTKQSFTGAGSAVAAGTGATLPPTDFLAWAHWLSNGRLLYGKQGGVGGENASQISARIVADSLSHGGHFCGITTGTNDASAGRTAAAYAADIKTMCAAVVAAGQTPILSSGVPTPDTAAGAYRKSMDGYRRFCRAYAADNGWPFVDFYSLLHDPATTGGYLAAYDSGDGIHPSNAGKKVMGQALVDALTPWLTPLTNPLPRVNDNTRTSNLISNALLQTDTNADGTPDGWTKSGGTVVYSLATDASVVGNAWRIRDTVSGGFTQNNFTIGSPTTLRGHRLAFTGMVRNDGASTWNLILGSSGSAANLGVRAINGINTPLAWSRFYIECLVPSDVTGVNLSYQSNGGATVDGYVAQLGVYDLTALGL